MIAHDPRRLKLTTHARFTEDTVEKQLGDSELWKSATALRTFRQAFLDVPAGVAAAHVVVEESGKPVMLALRLKIDGGKLGEIETLTVHSAQEGMFFDVDALRAPSPAMNVVPTAAQRDSRDNAISIAEGYPAGLRIGSFVTGTGVVTAGFRARIRVRTWRALAPCVGGIQGLWRGDPCRRSLHVRNARTYPFGLVTLLAHFHCAGGKCRQGFRHAAMRPTL